MKNWDELPAYVLSTNYRVPYLRFDAKEFTVHLLRTGEQGDLVKVTHATGVREEKGKKLEWAVFQSTVGRVPPEKIPALLQAASSYVCGGIVADKDGTLVLRHSVVIDEVSPERFDILLAYVSRTAGELNRRFVETE